MMRTWAITLLALGSLGAQAAAEYSGHLGTDPVPFTAPHGFLDVADEPLDLAYVFELTGRQDAFAMGAVFDPGAGFTATGTMLSLWRSNGDDDYGNDQLVGGFDFGEQPAAQSFLGLGSGEYFWRLESRVTGSDGWITFSAHLAPAAAVPEPASAALLVAGALGLGIGVYRRGRSLAGRDVCA